MNRQVGICRIQKVLGYSYSCSQEVSSLGSPAIRLVIFFDPGDPRVRIAARRPLPSPSAKLSDLRVEYSKSKVNLEGNC